MKKLNRRDFMKSSVVAAAGVSLASCATETVKTRIRGTNEDVRLAICGIRGQGNYNIDNFRKIEGVRIVALCDPDRKILADRAKKFTDVNETVDTYTDVRKLLDDKNIDAIVIATPNHWHSLIAIWACQAGKDVYVEKPISHNISEGRKLIEATKKYNRIVQAGTQNRSDTGMIPAMKYVHSGKLGKILYVHGLCYRRRKSIGKVDGPQPIPGHIDYNLWTGPAPLGPLRRKNLHYDWHWCWPTGNGDIGNQGPHEMDLCAWALQKAELPRRVISIGGRFGYVDDADSANTQLAVLEYDNAPIIFEVRNLPKNKDMQDAMDECLGIRVGIIIKCENGYFAGGRGGGWVYDNDGGKIKHFPGDGGRGHHQNFIDAVRSRKRSELRADILKGHICAGLSHMANISYRLGQNSTPETALEAIQDHRYASERFEQIQKHLLLNDVDIAKTGITVGPMLEMDPKTERFVGDGEYSTARWANDMLTRRYRTPFVVPDKV